MVGDLRRLAIGRGQGGAGAKAPVRLIYVVDVDKLVHTSGYQEPGLRDPDVQQSYYHVDTGMLPPEEGALRLPMKLSGNVVLVTGGATGIGFAMAEAFLKAGSEVIICSRRKARLKQAQMKHPELHVKTCDVASRSDCRALARWVGAHFEGLNVLVNNAGIQRDIDFTNGVEEFLAGESEIRINLEAPILLCGLFIPQLVGKSGSTIINVSSGLGFVPAARMPVYSATKAGMHAFTMALRYQLSKLGIKVFEVVPPAVDTELNPEGRAGRGGFKAGLTPEEFTATVMKGLEGDVLEIGYGMTAGLLKASRAELDAAFQRMNSRW